jgi:hypothetical protein
VDDRYFDDNDGDDFHDNDGDDFHDSDGVFD